MQPPWDKEKKINQRTHGLKRNSEELVIWRRGREGIPREGTGWIKAGKLVCTWGMWSLLCYGKATASVFPILGASISGQISPPNLGELSPYPIQYRGKNSGLALRRPNAPTSKTPSDFELDVSPVCAWVWPQQNGNRGPFRGVLSRVKWDNIMWKVN